MPGGNPEAGGCRCRDCDPCCRTTSPPGLELNAIALGAPTFALLIIPCWLPLPSRFCKADDG